MKRSFFAMTLAAGLGIAPAVHATKPCQPSPCETSSGQFDRSKCVVAADWIAQGTITHVKHHREGLPTNKDFAEFKFQALSWEKNKRLESTFMFKVGWCENRQELPERTAGLFRVFGVSPRAGAASGPRYLYLEPIVSKK